MVFYIMSFKDRLKEEIAYKGFLLKELADKAKVPKRTLDSYVDSRGIIPPANIAVQIAEVLDVSVEYLVTGKDNKIAQNIEPYRELIAELSKLSEESRLELQPLLLAQVREKQKQERKKNSEKIYAG